MSKLSKRWLSLITTLAVAFVMCFGSVGVYATDAAQPEGGSEAQIEEPAAEPEAEADSEDVPAAYEDDLTAVSVDPEAALTVIDNRVDGEPKVTSFKQEELQKMLKKNLNYSGINNYGTVGFEKKVSAVPLSSIFSKADVTVDDTDKIIVAASDDYSKSFDWSELNVTRYYYPYLASANAAKGPVSTSKANKSRAKVVPALTITGEHQLLFGQAYPSERNTPNFVKGVTDGGVITIEKAGARKTWDAAAKPSIPSGSTVMSGTELSFNDFENKGYIYYTVDGSDPTVNSAIFNYNTHKSNQVKVDGTQTDWAEKNPVILDGVGTVTVKTIVRGMGSDDSTVAEFTYNVTPALTVTDTTVSPAKVKTFSKSQLEKMVTSGHNYSKINNQGTVKVEKGYKGVQVQKILSTAKITPGKSDAIVFSTAPDEGGQTDDISFDWSEFNKTRYYYPNLASADADKGPVKTSTANKGKKTTKSIICLDGDTTLMFGQAYPTERNNPKFWDGVAAGGSITIVPAANEKWEEAPMPTLADGTAIENGATFDLNTELGYTTYSGKGFVYYTIDGSTPSGNSAIYNYAPKKGGTNPIVLSKAGKVRIKAVVKGVGKADSKVTTYTCYVNKGNIADKAKGAYIDGDTQVYNGKKKTPKVVIPGLKSGTDYSVSYESNKLVGEATATVVGKGNYKGSFSLHFEIVPAKAAISSITSKVAGQLVVAIKSQKSSGVDGYVIEFKKSTEDWENCVRVDLEPSSTKEALEGLDSGETYNVRVMAYTSIGSEDKYGQVSTVKTIKVK